MLLTLDNKALKHLLDPIGAPTFVVDVLPDGSFRYAAFNARNEARSGIRHEDAVGLAPSALLDAETGRRIEARYAACVAAREITEYDEELALNGRRRVWHMSLSPLMNAEGRVARILGTASDVTELRAQQDELGEREQRLSDLIEGSLQGIVIHRHHRPLFVNAAFAEIYGYDSPDDVLAETSLIHLVAPEERQASALLCQMAERRDSLDHFARARGLTRTGFPLWIELRARRIEWDGLPALQMTVVDVTARKRYEDELLASKEVLEQQADSLAHLAEDLEHARAEAEQARKTAEQANRSKSQFLATMSHELRTPLNAILGFSEIIAEQAFGEMGVPQYAEYARDINASGRHLLELINDILDIAKIEAGKLEIQPGHQDLEEVLEACRRLCVVKAHERGIGLDVEIAPGAQLIYADARALKQILFNLLTNAVKFSERGGRVVLSASRADGDWVELAVSDRGIGIPQDQVSQVFEPFHQLDNSYNREASGTGLGLALVKALTELHGGRVRMDSRPGEGTTVTLLFPPPLQPRRDDAACADTVGADAPEGADVLENADVLEGADIFAAPHPSEQAAQ